jgi:flagellin
VPLKINQNIFSLITQRNLEKANQKYQKSMDRVSSGERLTRAADDPAAMATSEALRFEIKGLQQNQLNLSGASSLLGTAESQLDNMTTLLQRARELTVEAGNDTLNADNRNSIQTELNEILDELNRIATTAKYGDRYLLNGQLQKTKIQIGTASTETMTITLGDYRTNVLGAWASLTPANPVTTAALNAGDVTINGIAVPASASDNLSSFSPGASAYAKAQAINSIESQTSVHAKIVPASVTASAAVQPVVLDGITNSLIINGVNIGALSVSTNDSNAALVDRINLYTNQTGVTAGIDNAGKLSLSASDGRNFTVKTTGNIGDELGLTPTNGDVNLNLTGSVTLTSVKPFSITDSTGALGLSTAPQQVNVDTTKALANLSVTDTNAVAATLNSIDAALSQINDGRSQIGAVSNRLEGLSELLSSRIEDLSSSDSKLRDTDFAVETARLTQADILQQAAVAMLAQANVTPRKALELLQQ